MEKIDCIQCSAVHFIFGDCWSAIPGSVKYLLIKHNLLPLPTTMTADPPGLCSLAGWDRGWKCLKTSQSWQALTHQTSDRQWVQNDDKSWIVTTKKTHSNLTTIKIAWNHPDNSTLHSLLNFKTVLSTIQCLYTPVSSPPRMHQNQMGGCQQDTYNTKKQTQDRMEQI